MTQQNPPPPPPPPLNFAIFLFVHAIVIDFEYLENMPCSLVVRTWCFLVGG